MIGETQPVLIKDYIADFTALINSKNNRMAWGGMAALNCITLENAKPIIEAGADVLVAGNTVFKSADPIATIAALKSL